MKKAIALILALILCLSLVACGKSPELVNVETLIDRIGTVTLESEEAIIKAEQAYEELYAQDQDKVKNIKKLRKAREEYNNLVLVQPTNCIQIDRIVTEEKTYDISYNYQSDGLIQQYTISYATTVNGTLYHYENTYDITYNSDGSIKRVTETAHALDEGIVNEFDWTDKYSSDGKLIKLYYDSFNMTFDQNGFMDSAEDIANSRTRTYKNTYDLDQGTGKIVQSGKPAVSWDYSFSIIQVPNYNQQVVMNLMSSILLTFG